ncbi:hypothetical protein [Vibrio metschnikovii]|uniref:Uncharacterized protein n=1 Tax=Vibrio metschnikovii TaxID=28172 RepID=A0A9X0UHJ4_VIBME|nr:hypothetical protein [Vibrio metschnikovii]MBC5851222.1 hypothetical protein [Vibrio metschnikovii]
MSSMTEEEKHVFSTHIVLTLLALMLTFSLLAVFAMFVANKAAIDSYDRHKTNVLTVIENTTDWTYSIKYSNISILNDDKVEIIGFANSYGQSITLESKVSVGIWNMNGSVRILGNESLLSYDANWTFIIGENDLLVKENGSIKEEFVDLIAIKESMIKDKK